MGNMSSKRMKGIEPRTRILKINEVNKFLEDSTAADFNQKVIEPLDKVRVYLEDLKRGKVLPEVADVTLRVTTLHTILDEFWRKTQNKYDEIINSAGEIVGLSFGDELIKFLRNNGQLPQNEQVLLNVWAKIDSNANWGEFNIDFDQTEKKVAVDLKKSIFTKGLKTNRHRHCKFTCGYLHGVLWSLLKSYYRWFKREVRPLEPMFEPISVIENRQRDDRDFCYFEIELKEEELNDAFDKLYEAKVASDEKNLMESAAKLRGALESAYKQILGFPIEDRTSLSILNKACKIEEVKLPHERIKDVYNSLSSIIHRGEPDLEKFKSYIFATENALKCLEKLEIDDNTRVCIRNKAMEIKKKNVGKD